LESLVAQAAWLAGVDGVPAEASTVVVALLQAAAGPESRHCCEPPGRLRFEGTGAAWCVEQSASGPQTD
jgi:hypothetical protein